MLLTKLKKSKDFSKKGEKSGKKQSFDSAQDEERQNSEFDNQETVFIGVNQRPLPLIPSKKGRIFDIYYLLLLLCALLRLRSGRPLCPLWRHKERCLTEIFLLLSRQLV